MAKYLDENGLKRLVDNVKTSQSSLKTKINSEIVARENFATDVNSSISALDTKIDDATADMIQTIALSGTTLSITSGAGTTDTYQIQDTTYDLATTVTSGLMSAADKIKLDGIDGDAEDNAIEEIFIDDVKQTVTNKKATLDLSDYAKKSDVASVWKRKGSVNSFSDLPADAEEGDVYNIKTAGGVDGFGVSIKAGDNVVRTFDGKWDVLAGTVDLSGYVEKVSGKQLSTNDFTDAQKTKLNNLASITAAGDNVTITNGTIKSANTTYSNATTTTAGLMSADDKKKLNNLASITSAGTNITISGGKISATDTTYSDATTSKSGLMSASDKTKLNGIAAYANNYTLPTASSSTLGGVKIGSGIAVSSGVISVPTVTSSANGLMTSSDKKKLDSLASITSAGEGITISGGTISRSNEFSTIDASHASIDADNATIKADGSSFRADNATIRAVGSSLHADNATIDADNATIRADGSSFLADNATIRAVGSSLLADNATIRAVDLKIYADRTSIDADGAYFFVRFSEILATSSLIDEGYSTICVGDSTIDASKSTIDASRASINVANASIDASGASIMGGTRFTGAVTLGGGFNANSATISADNSSLHAQNATVNARGTYFDLQASTLDAPGGRGYYIAGHPMFTDGASFDGNVYFNSNPTFNGEVTFNKPIYIDNTGSAVKGALCFDMDSGKPRLKMRIPGSGSSYTDFIFNCDTSVTGGTG